MSRAEATQLRLPQTGWGGRRAGAGRRPDPSRSRVRHRTRPALGSRYPVHVTCKLLPRVGDLRRDDRVRLVERCFAGGCDKDTFRLVHYSIQGDHLHLLVEARDAGALARGVQGLCIRIAKAINCAMGMRGRVFGDRYHMHILRTPREVRNSLRYVLNNGASHTARRGLRFVGQEPDPCSSGRFFDGWARPDWPVPEVEPALRPVRAPHTWLLAKGWRRHGLIALGEVSTATRVAGERAGRRRARGPVYPKEPTATHSPRLPEATRAP